MGSCWHIPDGGIYIFKKEKIKLFFTWKKVLPKPVSNFK